MKKAALLVNLGTPQAATPQALRVYLREFLMDPYVIDLPWFARWLLVHGAILRTRPARSAEAYRKIWTEKGSPLAYHHGCLEKEVQLALGEEWYVRSVMRYGAPSIREGLQACVTEEVDELVIFPLYPHYSAAATESTIQEAIKQARDFNRTQGRLRSVRVVEKFFHDSLYIEAISSLARSALDGFEYDFLLFSFHGLPERQVRREDRLGHGCLRNENCCSSVSASNSRCYRAQCFLAAQLIAEDLGIPQSRFQICFQSRLGRTPWISPSMNESLATFAQTGARRVAIISPSFVADCLETLEEIQLRGREYFLGLGGMDLKLVPSLNSHPSWVRTVARILRGDQGGTHMERRYSIG